jgi:hypothetical protein
MLFFGIFLGMFPIGAVLVNHIDKLRQDQSSIEPWRYGFAISIGPITAPLVRCQSIHQTGPQGVSMDVVGQLQQIGIIFNNHIFKSTLEKVAAAVMAPIKSIGIGDAKPMHTF